MDTLVRTSFFAITAILLLADLSALGIPSMKDKTINIVIDTKCPLHAFGAGRLANRLEHLGRKVTVTDIKDAEDGHIGVKLVAPAQGTLLKKEGFCISRNKDAITVTAIDNAGALYGLLELSEQISIAGGLEGVRDTTQNPRFSFRAIKFNLPWSSYRQFPALQANMEACRDLTMWEAFLDMMAMNRFNTLTLWNLHPWPYLVKPSNFPKATELTDAELAEWRQFWTTLFRMAKDRGIDTYILNWNVFVSKGFKEHYGNGNVDGPNYYVNGIDSPRIRRYNRECITQVINEYPDLTGLGVTLGEGMGGWNSETQTDWVQDVFFKGVEAANRPIKFIYRAALKGNHAVHRRSIDESGLDTPQDPIIVELKFNWSHGHSSPALVKAHGGGTGEEYWTDPTPTHHKMAWMIRNEDFFRLRWGDPDFIRDHIRLNGQDHVGGYFIGSECYIPACDIFHIPDHRHVSWKWAFERQWLYYMQWGRLLYDPNVRDSVFAHAFNTRYQGDHGRQLVTAFKLSTRTTQRIAGSFWWSWDFTFYTEGFLSRGHFLSLDELMRTRATEPSFVSVKEYKDGSNDFGQRITPPQLAASLERDCGQALEIVGRIDTKDETLRCEIDDIRAWSHLGLYFAKKLQAAVAFRQGNKSDAIRRLKEASLHWKDLVKVTEAHLQESSLGQLRKGNFHWKNYQDDVDAEIEWVKK